MKEIRIFNAIHAKRGAFIPDGRYDYTKSESELPAMQTTWKVPKMMGAFFSSEQRMFIFAEHAIKIAPVDDKISHGAAKWSGGGPGIRPRHIPGIIGLVSFGVEVVRGATTDTTGTKGFIFNYANHDGYRGVCWAIAPAACVEEILTSVPADRIDLSIAPK